MRSHAAAALVCFIFCWSPSSCHASKHVIVEGDTLHVSTGAWSGAERSWLVTKPGNMLRRMYLLGGLFSSSETSRVLKEASRSTFETTADSVDKKPAYELYVVRRGRVAHQLLADALSPFVDTRLLPYVQDKYNCSECVVCHILLRRYRSHERITHPIHFDEMAFVTAVADLDSEAHTGGLYVQTGPHVESRWFVPPGNGSVVFHQYDLDHGVDVSKGQRTSLILWISTGLSACEASETPWYAEAVAAGDADAQANYAGCYARGLCGVPLDLEKAGLLNREAAEQGHWQAQCTLADSLQAGWGLDMDEVEARKWYSRAADAGYALAQLKLGKMQESGAGGPQNDTAAALNYHRSAKQNITEAQFRLAWAYMFGKGVAHAEPKKAIKWMRRAADGGHARAIGTMGDAYRRGQGVKKDHQKALYWYRRALATEDDTVRSHAEKYLKQTEL